MDTMSLPDLPLLLPWRHLFGFPKFGPNEMPFQDTYFPGPDSQNFGCYDLYSTFHVEVCTDGLAIGRC